MEIEVLNVEDVVWSHFTVYGQQGVDHEKKEEDAQRSMVDATKNYSTEKHRFTQLVNLHGIIILHSNPPNREIRTKADGLNCYDDGDGGGKQPHLLRQFSDENATRDEAERQVDVE